MVKKHFKNNEEKSICGRFTLEEARSYSNPYNSGENIFNSHTTNNIGLVSCKFCLKKLGDV